MRAIVFSALMFLSACATDKLGLNPPGGVDFSGKWKLDEADSDDPQHLLQSSSPKTPQPDGSEGGRRGGRGQRGGAPPPGYGGPSAPPMAALGGPLRWPGKRLDVTQVGGVVSFSSDGRNRVCQPGGQHQPRPKADYKDREAPASARDNSPPVCGWDSAVLVIKPADDDDRQAFEEHYSLSDDRQRLVESVVFTRGRSNGFTLSRVWERLKE
jgi:hypothetical protein